MINTEINFVRFNTISSFGEKNGIVIANSTQKIWFKFKTCYQLRFPVSKIRGQNARAKNGKTSVVKDFSNVNSHKFTIFNITRKLPFRFEIPFSFFIITSCSGVSHRDKRSFWTGCRVLGCFFNPMWFSKTYCTMTADIFFVIEFDLSRLQKSSPTLITVRRHDRCNKV